MELYNNYMSLKKAMEALVNETSVTELAVGEFTANELRLARGIQAGFNVDDSGLSSGSYTRTDYNYGLAIKLVEDGTPELVVDEQVRRYAFAVASVRGNSDYKLGIHFDQTQLEFAEAVADSLSNPYLYVQQLWSPSDITSTLVWLDATDTATLTTNESGRLVWLDKSPLGFDATETVGNAVVGNTPNFVEFQGNSRVFLPSPISVRSMFFVTNKCIGSTTNGNVAALAGENIADENLVNHVFLRINTVKDYDISIDGGKGNTGIARINGEQGQGDNIIVSASMPAYTQRPLEATYVQHDENLNYQLIANMRNPVGFYPLDGDVGQVMFFSTVLSSDDIERLEGYYRAVYGYTLPPAHPFATHPYVYPLTVEAEDYTNSFDTTPGNVSNFYRNDSDTDTSGFGSFAQVSSTAAGEWMEYEIDVKLAGDYKVTSIVSSGASAPAPYNIEYSANGTTATCSFSPLGWGTYQNIDADANITLVEGKQFIRATVVNGSFNFDKFILTKV